MKKLIEYFINQSLLVNLICFIILVGGSLSLYFLQKETFPRVDFDVIMVTTAYPGASAEDVEKLVTIPIERKIKAVEGIKIMNGLSSEGFSLVYLEVEADANLNKVLEDIKNEVDTVENLPEDAEIPKIKSLNNKLRSSINIAVTGEDYLKIRSVGKDLRDEIEALKPISSVKMGGYRVDEIKIEADVDKLNYYELTLNDLKNTINDLNFNLSAGKIETPNRDIIVRTLTEFQGIKDIEQAIVRSNSSGNNVKISDVAQVVRVPETGTILERSNGKQAIFLNVVLKENSDIIRSTDRVKALTKDFFHKLKIPGIEYAFSDDLSYYVRRRLNILTNNGLLGLLLVFCCLLFFLNFGTSVVTSLGAPLAFMISFVAMDYMGVSINLISMFALILVLGMLVDDSIIVAEQFYQKLEEGMDPKEAAKQAALDTIKPVTATIATTVVAFGSMYFMGGIMGKFLWAVPTVVIICLAASLFECFFILPSHLADFCRLKKIEKKDRWYTPLLRLYEKTLRIVLKIPMTVQFLFLALLIGTLVVAKNMRLELFPGDDVRIVMMQIKGPLDKTLNHTDVVMRNLEREAMKGIAKNEKEQIRGIVGKLRGSHGDKIGPQYGSLILYLTPPTERKRSTDQIVEDLRKAFKPYLGDYVLTIKKMKGGPPTGRPVEIELRGDSLERLSQAADEVKALMEKTPGVTSSEIDFEKGKLQSIVKINYDEAQRLGVSSLAIARTLRLAFAGDSLTEKREDDEDIKIKLLVNEKAKSAVETIGKLHVLNRSGRRISLKRLVRLSESPGAFVIRRQDQKRIIAVSGSIDSAKTTPKRMAKVLTPKVKAILVNYPSLKVEFGGENKDTNESMQRLLKSGILAMLCIFCILVVMFGSLLQPIVVMMAIPLGLIGVVWTFKMMGLSLGFMALMGVVALVGVVVNDSIVLVNFINKRREKNPDLIEAIIEASRSRFRPVLLTTFTTVAGLLPLAHAKGGDPFLKPMALSFAYGLLFATFVTLVFIPANYFAYCKFVNGLNKAIDFVFKRKNRTPESNGSVNQGSTS